VEKNRKGHGNYQFHMEVAKKIHESLKKAEKINDFGFCWNDWVILWMDDYNLKSHTLFKLHALHFGMLL